jgi:hypothetical protein
MISESAEVLVGLAFVGGISFIALLVAGLALVWRLTAPTSTPTA